MRRRSFQHGRWEGENVYGGTPADHARIAEAEAAFYAVGTMLLGLGRPEVLGAFGAKTFAAFLDAHVMPAATANRYMTVAREFEADQAAELGVLKAFHLVQYARVARTRFRASVFATRGSRSRRGGCRR